jgi:heme/copper-type cytochrome/quinol oxidase subunit 2
VDVTASASFEAGVVTTETNRVKARIGDTVEIIVTSDVAEEVHLHGYDIVADLEPSVATTLRFTADIPGIFELEMENSGTLIFELEVS